MSLPTRNFVRLVVILLMVAGLTACAAQKRAKRPAPVSKNTATDTSTPPQISACREYADTMAGRQMERDFDSIQGNFQGGNGVVFQDFARMDAQRYYQQLYESCLSQHRAAGKPTNDR